MTLSLLRVNYYFVTYSGTNTEKQGAANNLLHVEKYL